MKKIEWEKEEKKSRHQDEKAKGYSVREVLELGHSSLGHHDKTWTRLPFDFTSQFTGHLTGKGLGQAFQTSLDCIHPSHFYSLSPWHFLFSTPPPTPHPLYPTNIWERNMTSSVKMCKIISMVYHSTFLAVIQFLSFFFSSLSPYYKLSRLIQGEHDKTCGVTGRMKQKCYSGGGKKNCEFPFNWGIGRKKKWIYIRGVSQ